MSLSAAEMKKFMEDEIKAVGEIIHILHKSKKPITGEETKSALAKILYPDGNVPNNINWFVFSTISILRREHVDAVVTTKGPTCNLVELKPEWKKSTKSKLQELIDKVVAIKKI